MGGGVIAGLERYVLGDVTDVMSMLSILGLLLFFLTPTFVVILIIYNVGRLQKKLKAKKDAKTSTEKTDETKDTDGTVETTDTKTNTDVTTETGAEHYQLTQDYTKFKSLALEFDEKGQVKE